MERIDIHNYETYLLDFSEGNLSDESQMELELFLIQHPELNIDLADISLVSIENEPIRFSNKNSLKKSETDLVSETQFISYIENQLSTEERLILEKSCAINPSLSKELSLYKSTIISDDKSVIYPNKNELKRKTKVIWFNFSASQFAAAACVVFLIGLFVFWSNTETTISNSQLADKTIKETSSIKKTNSNGIVADLKNITSNVSNIKQNNKSIAQNSMIINSQLPIETNTITSQNTNVTSSSKDSIRNFAINNSSVENTKKEIHIAQNPQTILKENTQTVVQVITENDEEAITLNTDKKKKGIWETVSRTLKNLNHLGVKYVNGDEANNKENTSYALTLGGISITHKAGNL